MLRLFAIIFLCTLGSLNLQAQIRDSILSGREGDTVKVVMKKSPKDSTRKFRFLWDKEPRKNIVQWNFVSTFVLTANFSYERIINKHMGILVGGYVGNYTLTSRTDSLPYDTKIFATSGYLEIKAYPWGTQGRGAYIGPYSSFRFMKLRSPEVTGFVDGVYTHSLNKTEVFSLAVGGVVGYRFILGNWFVINVYGGAGYNMPRFHFFDGAQRSDFNTKYLFLDKYEVRFGMNLGIALK